jgi:hypothetical protein
MSLTVSAITWTYLAANSARGAFYLPQIRIILKCSDGARSVSLLSWSIFALSHASALVYAVFCAHDWSLALMSAVNVSGSGLIAILTAWKRASGSQGGLRRATAPATDRPAIER